MNKGKKTILLITILCVLGIFLILTVYDLLDHKNKFYSKDFRNENISISKEMTLIEIKDIKKIHKDKFEKILNKDIKIHDLKLTLEEYSKKNNINLNETIEILNSYSKKND